MEEKGVGGERHQRLLHTNLSPCYYMSYESVLERYNSELHSAAKIRKIEAVVGEIWVIQCGRTLGQDALSKDAVTGNQPLL